MLSIHFSAISDDFIFSPKLCPLIDFVDHDIEGDSKIGEDANVMFASSRSKGDWGVPSELLLPSAREVAELGSRIWLWIGVSPLILSTPNSFAEEAGSFANRKVACA